MSSTKEMEREIWEYVLRSWEVVIPLWNNDVPMGTSNKLVQNQYHHGGLCHTIDHFADKYFVAARHRIWKAAFHSVRKKVYEHMNRRIDAGHARNYPFIWPRTRRGAAARRAFCNRQLRLLAD